MTAWPVLLLPAMAGTAYKKGLVTTARITAAPFQNMNNVATWLYNYNVVPSSKVEVDFVNSNDMEFIPMFNGAYAQTEFALGSDEYGEAPTGWPLAYGTNRRCYTWVDSIPTSTTSPYFGSSVCTKEQLITLINASNSVLNVPLKRIMMFNEPYIGAAYEQAADTTAHWYKDVFQEVVLALGLKITSATTSHSQKSLDWDELFLKTCMDLGCDLSLIDEWSIHNYNTKQTFWEQHYTAYTGTFYTAHEALFASGYGSWSASQWQSYFRNNKLRITEHSAEQETGTSFGVPDNQGTCARYTTQFGGPSTCVGNACQWGNGSLWWMLQPEQTNIVGICNWPMYYPEEGGNQEGARSSRLVYKDGALTPTGRAFIAAPNGANVDCNLVTNPSPPPPPTPPPAPLECASMEGRVNTYTSLGLFCYELKTTTEETCENYYSLNPSNNRLRLCINPIGPATDPDTFCGQSSSSITCAQPPPPLPPSPPPSPPPESPLTPPLPSPLPSPLNSPPPSPLPTPLPTPPPSLSPQTRPPLSPPPGPTPSSPPAPLPSPQQGGTPGGTSGGTPATTPPDSGSWGVQAGFFLTSGILAAGAAIGLCMQNHILESGVASQFSRLPEAILTVKV